MSNVTVTIDLSDTDTQGLVGAPVMRQLWAGASRTATGTVGSTSVTGQRVACLTPDGDPAVLDAQGEASFVLERTSDMPQSGAFWVVEVAGSRGTVAQWRVYVDADTPSPVAVGALTQASTSLPPNTYPDAASVELVAHKGQAGGYAALSGDGEVLDGNGDPVTGGGGDTAPIVLVPQPLSDFTDQAPPHFFVLDLSAAQNGDHFINTPVPDQGAAVTILIAVPPPSAARSFGLDYRIGSDATSLVPALFPPDFPDQDGYPTTFYREVFVLAGVGFERAFFPGDANGRLSIFSIGTGNYGMIAVDLSITPSMRNFYFGQGTDNGQTSLGEAMGHHEGELDRKMWCSAISTDPAFDINNPVWTFGAPVADSDVAALALTDGTEPLTPWSWHVEGNEEDGFTYRPWTQPDVFNPPGNGYTVTFNTPGDPDDGRYYLWKFDDPRQIRIGGSPIEVIDPTGSWAIFGPPDGFISGPI